MNTARVRDAVRRPAREPLAEHPDHKGRVAYLKTFRLSEAQIRRGHLLQRLADADWSLSLAAREMGTGQDELVRRIRAAGFESLLRGRGSR